METQLTVDGKKVSITLTKEQLVQIDKQVKKSKLSIIERINSYEDACEELGICPIKSLSFENPTTESQELHNTFDKLLIIAKALLEGKVLDWDNSNEKKWYCYFDMRGGFSFRAASCRTWATVTFAAARLCVDTQEKAEHFGTKFLSLWKVFHGHKK